MARYRPYIMRPLAPKDSDNGQNNNATTDLDASTEYFSWKWWSPIDMLVSKIAVRVISATGNPVYEISLYKPNTSGDPGVQLSGSTKQFTITAAGKQEITLDNVQGIHQGQEYFCVVKPITVSGSQYAGFSRGNRSASFGESTSVNFMNQGTHATEAWPSRIYTSTDSGSTWTDIDQYAMWYVESNDATPIRFGQMRGIDVGGSASGWTALPNTWYGAKFRVRAPFRCCGIGIFTATPSSLDVAGDIKGYLLTEDGQTVLGSGQRSSGFYRTTAVGGGYDYDITDIWLDTEIDLSPMQWYIMAVRDPVSTGSDTVGIAHMDYFAGDRAIDTICADSFSVYSDNSGSGDTPPTVWNDSVDEYNSCCVIGEYIDPPYNSNTWTTSAIGRS